MCFYSSHSGTITWVALYGGLLILKVDSPEAAIARIRGSARTLAALVQGWYPSFCHWINKLS
jgi:hypothetical protein